MSNISYTLLQAWHSSHKRTQ